jgi:hypothetical protein
LLLPRRTHAHGTAALDQSMVVIVVEPRSAYTVALEYAARGKVYTNE